MKTDLDTRRITASADREKLVIRYYTAAVLCLAFEKLNVYIFGSQLAALQRLNTRGGIGADQSEILTLFFAPAKAQFPQVYKAYSFEQWLQYLLARDVIVRNATRLVITAEGKEFLKYLVDQGYSLVRLS